MSHVDGDAKEMEEEVQAYRAPLPRKKKWPQVHAMEPHRAIETRGTDNSSPTFKKVGRVVSCEVGGEGGEERAGGEGGEGGEGGAEDEGGGEGGEERKAEKKVMEEQAEREKKLKEEKAESAQTNDICDEGDWLAEKALSEWASPQLNFRNMLKAHTAHRKDGPLAGEQITRTVPHER